MESKHLNVSMFSEPIVKLAYIIPLKRMKLNRSQSMSKLLAYISDKTYTRRFMCVQRALQGSIL
jgi:hypothetical protein